MFFTNSGAEANEAAFKLTRRTGRTHVVAAEGGFHGRTMGALALTSKAAYREPFEPLPGDVTFVPVRRRRRARGRGHRRDRRGPARADPGRGRRRGAARRLPRRGPADRRRARRPALARRGADRHGPDRRRGSPTSTRSRACRRPTSSRSPRASAAASRSAPASRSARPGKLLEPGNHGTTFGGNPVACAAALAVLDTIEDDGLLEHVTGLGARARATGWPPTRGSPRCAARAC